MILLIATSIYLNPALPSASSAFVLQKLETSENPSGCSCSMTNSKGEYLLSADLLDKASVTVRIEGQKKILHFVSSTEKTGDPKKGDSFTRIFSDGTIKLKLNYRTLFACPPDSESCEVTRYSVDGTLEAGKRTSKFKNLRGECGC